MLIQSKRNALVRIAYGIALYFLLFCPIESIAAIDADKELQVETAFLYQFTNYIEWPATKNQDSFQITVVGNSPIVQLLEGIAKQKTVKGKPIKIITLQDAAGLKDSNMIVLSTGNENTLREIVKKSKTMNALIVTFSSGFAKKGAMINFYEEDGRLRFEINRHHIEEKKLVISSQLLKLAKIVE